jgi:hypothetical protein
MSAHEFPRCTFTTRDGRRCRMLCATQSSPLCFHHLRRAMLERGEAPTEPPPLIAAGAARPAPPPNPGAQRKSVRWRDESLLTIRYSRFTASMPRWLNGPFNLRLAKRIAMAYQ